jgi:NAD(P)-dependent dehydrogenase (short-subunit alcohol dehydrogenase family)
VKLRGRRAIVTGGSRGMGRHIAAALVAEGAQVAILARASDALDQTAQALGQAALPVACDITDPASVRAAFAQVRAAFDGLDVLINNAGMSIPGQTEHYSDDDIAQQIGVNFTGAVHTCREAIPLLRQSDQPHILCVSSESVKTPYAQLSLYTASKAALENYCASLRKELRDDGIRVTVLRSGLVGGSEMQRNWHDPARKQAFLDVTRLWGNSAETGKTPAPPEAMAETVVAVLTARRELNIDLIEVRPLLP